MKKWSGQLPRRNYKNPSYSTKVFLGGVPWDITEGKFFISLAIHGKYKLREIAGLLLRRKCLTKTTGRPSSRLDHDKSSVVLQPA